MKKILLSIIAFICFAVVCNVLLTSCGGGGDGGDVVDVVDGEGSSGGENKSPRTYSRDLTINASDYYSDTISLYDLQTYIVSAESSEDWVTLIRQQYTSGSPKIRVDVCENYSFESRTCEVTITASDGNKVIIKITQKGRPLPNKINEYTDQPALTKRLN